MLTAFILFVVKITNIIRVSKPINHLTHAVSMFPHLCFRKYLAFVFNLPSPKIPPPPLLPSSPPSIQRYHQHPSPSKHPLPDFLLTRQTRPPISATRDVFKPYSFGARLGYYSVGRRGPVRAPQPAPRVFPKRPYPSCNFSSNIT